MAKKLRKRPVSPLMLFVKLLTPWIVMGAVAIVLSAAGSSEALVYSGALAGALLATLAIYLLGNRRQRMRALLRRD